MIYKALILCLFLFSWGCSGGSGPDKETVIPKPQSGTVSDKAVIGSSTGGAISVATKSGLAVMVDIPAEAMEYSREITLSVEQDDATGEVAIEISPPIALMGQASLMVTFTGEGDWDGRILCRKASGGPMKQGMNSGTITSSIYRLGEFTVRQTDEDDLLDAAFDVIASSPDGSWQDAYATFDSLIWLSDYFSRQGLSRESLNCFSSIVSKSKESADMFLESIGTVEKGDPAFIALQKFQNLMTLCENPDQILSTINSLLTGNEDE